MNLPNEILNIIFSYIPPTATAELLKYKIKLFNNSMEWNLKQQGSINRIGVIYLSMPFYQDILQENKKDRYYIGREKRNKNIYKELKLLKEELNENFLQSKILFGKYKGYSYNLISSDYLNWMIKNNVLKNQQNNKYLKELIKYRELENTSSFLSRDPYN